MLDQRQEPRAGGYMCLRGSDGEICCVPGVHHSSDADSLLCLLRQSDQLGW